MPAFYRGFFKQAAVFTGVVGSALLLKVAGDYIGEKLSDRIDTGIVTGVQDGPEYHGLFCGGYEDVTIDSSRTYRVRAATDVQEGDSVDVFSSGWILSSGGIPTPVRMEKAGRSRSRESR